MAHQRKPLPEFTEPSGQHEFLGMKMVNWWYFMLGCQSIILIMMLVGLDAKFWVKQNGEPDEGVIPEISSWEGSLLYVTQGDDSILGRKYSQLAKIYCDGKNDPSEALCASFGKLSESGTAFVVFSVVGCFFNILWMVKVCSLILETKFMGPISGFIWPTGGFSCHLLSEIIWRGTTSINPDECNKLHDGSDPAEFCETEGPSIVLITTIIFSVIYLVYLILYIKKEYRIPTQDEVIGCIGS